MSTTNLKRGSWLTIEEDGRAPRTASKCWLRFLCCSENGSGRDFSVFGIAPERNQKLACHRDDRDTSGPPFQIANPLVEPGSEFAFGLITQPKPSRLDQCLSRSSIACSSDAPVSIDIATLVRHGRKANITCQLFPVPKMAIEDLACQHRCEVVTNAVNLAESCHLRGDRVARCGSQMFIALGVQLADQFSDKDQAAT